MPKGDSHPHPFCAQLASRARQNKTRIVLPEMADARVAKAAKRAAQSGIAECISPPPDAASRYLTAFMKTKAARGMDEKAAQEALQNEVIAAAMMVQNNDADGMVAGAVVASADVLRPALRIIGADDGNFVSSLFFMCFADGAKVFADCALNIAPSPQQLANIATQSAKTAKHFGINPVVAMLSFITGGDDNENPNNPAAKIMEAMRHLPPDITAAGPIQYDAAINPEVGKRKAPGDKAAGRATVLIFPDLSSGNIAYKAVQQSAGMIAIGPLLQGLAKPVNDLSRGATSEDIYYTIAATAIQATN